MHVNNIEEPFSLNPKELVSRKGFDEHHFFGIGDSIIKQANSSEVVIKNEESIVIFILECDE